MSVILCIYGRLCKYGQVDYKNENEIYQHNAFIKLHYDMLGPFHTVKIYQLYNIDRSNYINDRHIKFTLVQFQNQIRYVYKATHKL